MRKRMKVVITAGVMVMIMAMVTEAESIVFYDDLGREMTVDSPERVAALLGSYADIWYLAGGEVCAAADDAWEDFELPLAEDTINLGMTKELNLEKLFEADPDFVLASTNTQGNLELMDILEGAGISVAYFDVSDFEDYMRVLSICTQITGRKDLYEKNGLQIQKRVEDAKRRCTEHYKETGEIPKILCLRASSALIAAKNSVGNVLGAMLKGAGCVNIADGQDTLLENLSMEQIMLRDPDFIFIAQFGDDIKGVQTNLDNFIKDNPAWAELTAVKEGKVYLMEKALYSLKPNDRWAEAYEGLEEILTNE